MKGKTSIPARKSQPRGSGRRQDSGALDTRGALARRFGVHLRTITTWAEEGMPVAKRQAGGKGNLYDPEACRAWRDQHHRQDTETYNLAAERAKLAQMQTQKTALEVGKRRGELVLRSQVILEGQGFVKAVRARLLNLPRRLTQLGVVLPEREGEVRDAVLEALSEMSRWSVAEVQAVAARSRSRRGRADDAGSRRHDGR